jgi:putative glycosyltransferase (TIGR04348 family)
LGGVPHVRRIGRRFIQVVTPAPRGARSGNRVTALRWAGVLRALGHRVVVREAWDGAPCDVLIALHALRSAASVERFRTERPGSPIVVALTGTDLYGESLNDARTVRSIRLASRLVLLQPAGVAHLPEDVRDKARVILQSARAPEEAISPPEGTFAVCVLAHLREVKDPFLAAAATRLLDSTSRVRVLHVGAAMDNAMRARALREQDENPRWRWLGERPRLEALHTLKGSHLLALTSRSEGGANVVSEAIACDVSVLSTRIGGSIGILGEDYPGYFPIGDAAALAALLARAEQDAAWREDLRARGAALKSLIDPNREREAWRALLDEIALGECP